MKAYSVEMSNNLGVFLVIKRFSSLIDDACFPSLLFFIISYDFRTFSVFFSVKCNCFKAGRHVYQTFCLANFYVSIGSEKVRFEVNLGKLVLDNARVLLSLSIFNQVVNNSINNRHLWH